MIRINNLSKIFQKEPLFENVNLVIQNGEKIALIGQNGSGKSTLIKCIAQEIEFEGTIKLSGNMKMSIMEQEKNFSESGKTFFDYLGEKQKALEEKLFGIEKKLSELSLYECPAELERVVVEHEVVSDRANERIEDENLKKILKEIKFDIRLCGEKIRNLSGGQKTKLRIAECLARDAGLYMLDEPTNHLDIETTQWLEKWIKESNATFIIISHDRYFLKNTVKRFFEIENKNVITYSGGYEKYLELREKHLERLKKEFHVVTKKKKRLLESAEEKREWASRGSRDSRHKKMAERMEKQAAELPEVFDPEKFREAFKIEFESNLRAGNIIFNLEDVSKSFGENRLFTHVNFEIERGDKVAIVGKNGSGKSTLIKMMHKIVKPNDGMIRVGSNVKIGYFDQELADIDNNQTVEEFLNEEFGDLDEHKKVAVAVRYGIPRESFQNKLKTLSGGEKSRINLVRLMVRMYNVLLLDEPTNNLDVELIRILEEALSKFEGTIVFVSHDRYFIDKVATRLIIIENGEISTRNGNFSDNFE
ncbi:MAG: ABC-F family ATP-binding cassette domain-containing protein [Candidatus Pacearchaeota archaeon]|nr:ABC-F family ATP-binding cassette domain-containing protein [Candidatus Pacearchaeota archaeon]